jgi:hypothetical protein
MCEKVESRADSKYRGPFHLVFTMLREEGKGTFLSKNLPRYVKIEVLPEFFYE